MNGGLLDLDESLPVAGASHHRMNCGLYAKLTKDCFVVFQST